MRAVVRSLLWILAFSSIASGASAQMMRSVGVVFSGGGSFTRGVSAPAILYSTEFSSSVEGYHMYFEGQQVETLPGCGSTWAIGRATGAGHRTFTLSPTTPVLEPRSGTFYDCSVAQPAVVHYGSLVFLYFTATGSSGTRGIGWGLSVDGVNFVVGPSPIDTHASDIGDPSAVIIADQVHLTYTRAGAIVERVFDIPTTSWVAGPTTRYSRSSYGWSSALINGSSIQCDEGTGQVQLFFYGEDSSSTRRFTSTSAWSLVEDGGRPFTRLMTSPAWRHWDVLPATFGGTPGHLLYFSEVDSSTGLSVIGLATPIVTMLPVVPSTDRVCL